MATPACWWATTRFSTPPCAAFGAVRVPKIGHLFAAAEALASGRLPRGNRLAIVTNGSGPGALAADAADDNHVELGAADGRHARCARRRVAARHVGTQSVNVLPMRMPTASPPR